MLGPTHITTVSVLACGEHPFFICIRRQRPTYAHGWGSSDGSTADRRPEPVGADEHIGFVGIAVGAARAERAAAILDRNFREASSVTRPEARRLQAARSADRRDA